MSVAVLCCFELELEIKSACMCVRPNSCWSDQFACVSRQCVIWNVSVFLKVVVYQLFFEIWFFVVGLGFWGFLFVCLFVCLFFHMGIIWMYVMSHTVTFFFSFFFFFFAHAHEVKTPTGSRSASSQGGTVTPKYAQTCSASSLSSFLNFDLQS